MTLTSVSPMLYTEELEATIAFYVDALGFECVAHEEEWGWAALRRGGVEIMLSLPNAHLEFDGPRFTGSLYLRCDDVDAEWERASPKADVAYPIEDFEYGMREFAVRDNNGYLIQFGAPVETGGEG